MTITNHPFKESIRIWFRDETTKKSLIRDGEDYVEYLDTAVSIMKDIDGERATVYQTKETNGPYIKKAEQDAAANP